MIRSGRVAAWLGVLTLTLLWTLGAIGRHQAPTLHSFRYEEHREYKAEERYELREAEDFAEYEDPYHRYLEALNENLRFSSSTSGADPSTAHGSPEESQAQQFAFALPATLKLTQARAQISVVTIRYESITDLPGGTGPVGARSPPVA